MKTLRKSIQFTAIALLAVSFLVGCEEHQTPPVNDDPPRELISVEQAKEMFDTYYERRVTLIRTYEEGVDSTREFHPTRFGEYDYATVKQYMAFIESEAKLANVEIGGLRFYLTNYPNANEFNDGTAVKYPRQNSFVLVPTTVVDGKQRGFITRVNSTGGRDVVLVSDLVQGGQDDEETQENQSVQESKVTGLNTQKAGYGAAKPKFLYINAMMGANMSQNPGDLVSLLLNESNLVPPPPQEDTDFDD
ncbi:hypothetical protein G5B37_00890 [Rasiella rasia]|uniref:Uncharacterized protein n=1 Tax=Rasiella rasia TaxID=2744027 RepID=A0A6G6GHY8_9FLAO|nr:hypothetical protein [Rasiella rasia]QIE58168.1 hypothetical protein G5B37_00890 [Rasiella rasia]